MSIGLVMESDGQICRKALISREIRMTGHSVEAGARKRPAVSGMIYQLLEIWGKFGVHREGGKEVRMATR